MCQVYLHMLEGRHSGVHVDLLIQLGGGKPTYVRQNFRHVTVPSVKHASYSATFLGSTVQRMHCGRVYSIQTLWEHLFWYPLAESVAARRASERSCADCRKEALAKECQSFKPATCQNIWGLLNNVSRTACCYTSQFSSLRKHSCASCIRNKKHFKKELRNVGPQGDCEQIDRLKQQSCQQTIDTNVVLQPGRLSRT